MPGAPPDPDAPLVLGAPPDPDALLVLGAPPDPDALLVPVVPLDAEVLPVLVVPLDAEVLPVLVVPLDAEVPPVPVVPLDPELAPVLEALSELSKRLSSTPPQAAGAPAARAASKRIEVNCLWTLSLGMRMSARCPDLGAHVKKRLGPLTISRRPRRRGASARLALGLPGPLGLEPQAIQWLEGHGGREGGAPPDVDTGG
jgi:hypothetical protein